MKLLRTQGALDVPEQDQTLEREPDLAARPAGGLHRRHSTATYQAAILFSALMFAVSSALAKLAGAEGVGPGAITFWRFAAGLTAVLTYLALRRPRLAPRNVPALILRGLTNLIAVFLFYCAVKYTTITNANLLNQTYLVFVPLLSPFLLSERLSGREWLGLAPAGVGIWLVVNPRFDGVNVGDLLGLACGFFGALSIITLCRARRDNPTVTVILFLMVTGAVLTWPAMLTERISDYSAATWALVLLCGATGVVGQFAVTLGFRGVSAFSGSMIGATRVGMAALIGMVWLGEQLTWNVVAGAVLLIGSGALVAGQGASTTANAAAAYGRPDANRRALAK